MYDENEKIKWDNAAADAYNLKKGHIEGEEKKALEIAKKLKLRGDSLIEIQEITGLSIGEIEKL